MNAAHAKPSQAHNDPAIMRAKADEANRKRRERKRAQERAEREAEERARQEAEEKARQEAEEVRAEEERMWEEAQAKPKAEKKSYKQGKIRTKVDGIEFDSLAKAMASIDPILWGKENDYRTSCWIKINRALKKDGVCIYGGHRYELAQ